MKSIFHLIHLLFGLLFSFSVGSNAVDPSYCSSCSAWTQIQTLQTSYDVQKPIIAISTGTNPVISVLLDVPPSEKGLAGLITCTDSTCNTAAHLSYCQSSYSMTQIAVTSLANGGYVVGSTDYEGTTELFYCQTATCANPTSNTVAWHVADSIGLATPFGSNIPVLFGAIGSTHQVEFDLCGDQTCTGTNYHYVSVPLLTSTATNSSFAIDGHSNYVALILQASSSTNLIMVWCHNKGSSCVSSSLRNSKAISKFLVAAPPNMTSYEDGQSYPVIVICQTASPVSVTFCLSDYCSQNTTVTFGTTATAATIAYGPDNLPVIAWTDNSGSVWITHCFDYICGSSMKPLIIGNSKAEFSDVTAVLNGQFILLSALDTVGNLWSTIFCGPFVTSYSPTNASVGNSVTISLQGSFCSGLASTCKLGSSSTASVVTATQVQCSFQSATAEEAPISVGNSGWSEYTTAGNFTFIGVSPSPVPSTSVTPTPSPSRTPSTSADPSPSVSPSTSADPSSSATPTSGPTPSGTPSVTASVSSSTSPKPSSSASPSPIAPSPSAPSVTTPSSSPSSTPSPTSTPSTSSTASSSVTPVASPSAIPTSSASSAPSVSSSPSALPAASSSPAASIQPSASSSPDSTPSPVPSPSESATPSASSSPSNGTTTDTNNTKVAVTMISIVLTAFFAASTITTYAYFRWNKATRYRSAVITCSWDNFITIVAIPLDFLQFCAFSTNIEAEWAQIIYAVSKGTIFEIPNTAYLALFWIVLLSTGGWCIYMAPFFIRFNWRGNRTPLVDWLQQTKVFKALYYPASLIMIPFGNCLFFAVSNVLLQMVSCDYWSDTDNPVLNMDNNIQCWTGVHIFLSILTLIVFFSYFPMAIHLMPKLQQVSTDLDIKYNEKFLFISSILKLLICVIHALFAEWEVPRLMTVCAVTLILTIVNMEMEPCNISRINSIRSAIYFAACCCAICSVGATFTAKTNIVPLIILMLCWFLIGILLILAQLGIVHDFISKKNNQLLRVVKEHDINEERETYIKFG